MRITPARQIFFLTTVITGCQGLTAFVTAKFLGAHDRGVITLAQTLMSVMLMVLSLGLFHGTRMILSREEFGIGIRSYVTATRWGMALTVLVASVVGSFLFPWLARMESVLGSGCFLVMVVCMFRSALLREALHGVGRHRAAMAGDLIYAVVPLAAAVILRVTGHLNVLSMLSTMAAAGIVAYASQWVAIVGAGAGGPADRSLVGLKGSWATYWRIVKISLPGLLTAAGLTVAGRIDRILLGVFAGPAAVGRYGTAGTLSDLAWSLPLAITPVVVRQTAKEGLSGHSQWWKKLMLASLVSAGLLMAAGYWLLEYGLGEDFAGASWLLAILLVGSLAMTSQQVDLAACAGSGNLRASANAAIWGVAVGLLGYVVLVPSCGAIGCAFANVLSYSVMAASARVSLRRLGSCDET